MFMSFIAGLVFGAGSGYFEKMIAAPLRKQFSLSDTEMGILSFGGLMLVASILISAIGVNSSAFWLVLGGTLGTFAIRSFVFGKAKMEERRLAAAEKASDMGRDAADAVSDVADEAADMAKDAGDAASDAVDAAAEKAKELA